MTHSSLLAPAVATALVAATLTVVQPASGAETTRVPLAEAAVPALVGDPLGLAAARDDEPVDPASTVFSAVSGEPVDSRLRVETSTLPAGVTVSGIALRYEQVSAPDGGSVAIGAIGMDGSRRAWAPGQDLSIDGDSTGGLAWTFDHAGRYAVRLTATVTLTGADETATGSGVTDGGTTADAAGGDGPTADATTTQETEPTAATTPDPVTLTADYTVEVTDPAPAAAVSSVDAADIPAAAADAADVPAAADVPVAGSSALAVGTRPIALTRGHIDLFEVTYDQSTGGLVLHVKDDTSLYGGTHFRDPADVAVWVDSAASALDTTGLPPAFSFLADDDGLVYHLPQTQDPDLPWPGWSTERLLGTLPPDVQLPTATDAVLLTLEIDGPGEVFTWQTGTFGTVINRYVDTTDPAPDVIPVSRNAHVHTSWAFTEIGDYLLTVTPSATTTTGGVLTGTSASYHVHVGPSSDAAPSATAPPTVTGRGEVGAQLTVTPGEWLPLPHEVGYQWLRDGEPIAGATAQQYTAVDADAGHALAARATARVGSATSTALSGPVAIAAAPVWDVPNGSSTDSGAVILNVGHVDVASLLDGGVLDTKIKDTTESAEPVWREPEETVLQARPAARTTVPDAPDFAFLGAPGADVWILPQIQDSAVLWPGWSTEEIPASATSGGVDWTLTWVDGPGEFALYEEDWLGLPRVFVDTRDGLPDTLTIPTRTHAHGSWAFSAAGTYCLGFERSATLVGGGEVSDEFALTVAVGEVDVRSVDPAGCAGAPGGEPAEDDTTPTPVDHLTEENAGGVQVLHGADGFSAGELVTVQVGADRAGHWVSVWLDDTDWLGWTQVGTSGAVQVRLPVDAEPGAHVLVVTSRTGALIGWDSLSVVAAEDPGGDDPGGDDDAPPPSNAVWDVPNGTVNTTGATVLNNGHVDVASLLDGTTLRTRVKDTTRSSTPTWRDPARTVLQLLPGSKATVPPGSVWTFLGQAGSSFYQVTQTQQPGLLWPGWSTEPIPPTATQGGVTWQLTDISGPGEFALYETGSFGAPNVLFTTRDGVTAADRFTIPKNTHAHGSWAFSAAGNYCLEFERSTTLASGMRVSDEFVLAVAVGTADVMRVDPAACFSTPAGQPTKRDVVPIPDKELTTATRGGVQALDGDGGFSAGQLVSLRVGAARAGAWVSVWLHSTPTWLGWTKVDADGVIRVRLPADAATGPHRLVVKAEDGTLIGWAPITVVRATTPGRTPEAPGPDGTPPVQQIPATQCVAGATILSSGHVDYATRIVGGTIESLIGDDTAGTKVYREPSGVILWLKPSSRVTLPPGYGAVGAAGSSVWQVPQSQNPDLIWLGWSTEALNAGNVRGTVSWTLNGVDGPGSVKVYLGGPFGGVQTMVLNGSGSSYDIPLGVHAHGNWAFSAEGIYRLTMTQTVTLANGVRSSDTETLTLAVGNVDPATVAGSGSGCGTVSAALLLTDEDQAGALRAAEQAAADAAEAASDLLPGLGTPAAGGFTNPFSALAQGDPVPLLLTILGGLLLAGAAGSGVLWWRRRRWEGVTPRTLPGT